MDLNQRKLNKSEWNSVEIPVSKAEISILNLITKGYNDVNIRMNDTNSIFMYLKIEYSEKMEDYLYNKYLSQRGEKIQAHIKMYFSDYKNIKVDSNAKINSADKIRLERNDENTLKKVDAYEYILFDHAEQILFYKKDNNNKMFTFHYYTLHELIKNNVCKVNVNVLNICNKLLELFRCDIQTMVIIENAVEFIEKNECLLKYGDLILYEHQKEIFTICKNRRPKLILYMAPTGTGKTLTPIALSEKHRIIFVCAARHVGLALARSAISVNKKIAFAFGCESANDIRLHYFAAKEYTKNKRSGGIGKVDNSIGNDVEIIICDIKSYLPAMYYMLAFNSQENIITYWDEPTITMDYQTHEFHEIIKKNWKENLIPNFVLSSATLPKCHELNETIADFKTKFSEGEIYNIVSHDCKKSIPIINKDGYIVLPHYLTSNYEEMLQIAKHCNDYLTLLRYFDLKEVVNFISHIIKNAYCINKKMSLDRNFESLNDINMKNIKIYYIKLLQNILPEAWTNIYNYFNEIRQPRIVSNETVDAKGNKITKSKSVGPGINGSTFSNLNEGRPISRLASEQLTRNETIIKPVGTSAPYVTTKDAYTLTDGPTIFISNEIEKIAKFCIQQANIPSIVMEDIMKKIEYNNGLNEKLSEIEKEIEFQTEKNELSKSSSSSFKDSNKGSSKDSKKLNREVDDNLANTGNISRLKDEFNSIRSMIKSVTLNDTFVPNKNHHIKKWAEELNSTKAFTSTISENIINEIMSLNDVNDMWKILLMMGIGVFINHKNIRYTEIMKSLADEQKLYMIIASSDYIYGTNYQFCHGYLSKDLDLTQEKIIQAMGRIGRNNIQQTYTLRFRDDAQILKLFTSETDKPEIINMNLLFNSRNVIWENNDYVYQEE
jgi:hypothetical protein